MRALQMVVVGLLIGWSGGAQALTDEQQACAIEAAQAVANRYPTAQLGNASAEVEAKAIAAAKFVGGLTSPTAFASSTGSRLGLFTATELERIKDAEGRGAREDARSLLAEKLIAMATGAVLVRVPMAIAGQAVQTPYTCLTVQGRPLIAPAR